MPLLTIDITESLSPEEARTLSIPAAKIVAEETGKPESVVMVRVNPGAILTFQGATDQIALFEIYGIELPPEKTASLTVRFCDFAKEHLGVEGERVFVRCTDVPRGRWGMDKRVF